MGNELRIRVVHNYYKNYIEGRIGNSGGRIDDESEYIFKVYEIEKELDEGGIGIYYEGSKHIDTILSDEQKGIIKELLGGVEIRGKVSTSEQRAIIIGSRLFNKDGDMILQGKVKDKVGNERVQRGMDGGNFMKDRFNHYEMNRVLVNYFMDFNIGDKNSGIYVEGKGGEILFNIDGNEYIRNRLGGNYIVLGDTATMIMRLEDGKILYGEYNLEDMAGKFNGMGEEEFRNFVVDVIGNMNWIELEDISYILTLSMVYRTKKGYSNRNDKKELDRIIDIKKELGEEEIDFSSKLKVIKFNINELIKMNDVKDIILNEKDIELVYRYYISCMGVEDMGGNRIRIVGVDYRKFTNRYMGIMNIIRKYNKKVDHLYNRLKNSGVGNGYYLNYNNGGYIHRWDSIVDYSEKVLGCKNVLVELNTKNLGGEWRYMVLNDFRNSGKIFEIMSGDDVSVTIYNKQQKYTVTLGFGLYDDNMEEYEDKEFSLLLVKG